MRRSWKSLGARGRKTLEILERTGGRNADMNGSCGEVPGREEESCRESLYYFREHIAS